jgi:hypothetical protein
MGRLQRWAFARALVCIAGIDLARGFHSCFDLFLSGCLTVFTRISSLLLVSSVHTYILSFSTLRGIVIPRSAFHVLFFLTYHVFQDEPKCSQNYLCSTNGYVTVAMYLGLAMMCTFSIY